MGRAKAASLTLLMFFGVISIVWACMTHPVQAGNILLALGIAGMLVCFYRALRSLRS